MPTYSLRNIPVMGKTLKHAIKLFNTSSYASHTNGGPYIPTVEDTNTMATELLEELSLPTNIPNTQTFSQYLYSQPPPPMHWSTHAPTATGQTDDNTQPTQKPMKSSDPNKTTISDCYKYKSLSKYVG